jgi:hypothetical protein
LGLVDTHSQMVDENIEIRQFNLGPVHNTCEKLS